MEYMEYAEYTEKKETTDYTEKQKNIETQKHKKACSDLIIVLSIELI